ncbi:MAG TPA: tRNA (adenosine(37)-N6)-threonylcarbamoyltransferase complex dimerization subunit type 1 TsaB [Bacteroidia bacterium]
MAASSFPLILCLETSTKVCSVALGQNGKLLALKESLDEKYSHSENLTLYIEDVCRQAAVSLQEIDAVAISKGPGSYTGLRIGVSAAKGLCYALNKPLIAVNTLEAMAAGQISNLKSKVSNLYCPMLDARRMEVYCAVYDENMKVVFPTSAIIVDENFISKVLYSQSSILNSQFIFFGDGAEKCKEKIAQPNARFVGNIFPSAQHLIPLAEKNFSEKKFEDLAYFEPFYLKDFVSGSAK